MSGIDTDNFMSISFDLQKIALIFVFIGFIILRMGKLNKDKLNSHDIVSTFAYVLVILSVSYMINAAYDAIISQSISLTIVIHALIGIIIIILGFVVVVNRRTWKLERKWKTKRNMQILIGMWVINFIIGAYLALYT
jgi:heme/copper-type cytochrome/quinol oxidase subunit 2